MADVGSLRRTTERVSSTLNKIEHLGYKAASFDETEFKTKIPKDLNTLANYKIYLAYLAIATSVVSALLVISSAKYNEKAQEALKTSLKMIGEKLVPAAGELPKAHLDANISKKQGHISLEQGELGQVRENEQRSHRLIDKNSDWKKEVDNINNRINEVSVRA